jgi:LysR family transcriptional regulator, glycine cleavage system transcriptional activator
MTYSLPNTLPPLESLAAAIAAARHGSFSAAAEDLGVTHAAISRRVAAAEHWAGLRLFERHGRGVRPTADGQRLLARLSQAIEALDQVAVRRDRKSRMNIVRLSTTASFARFWLLPRLADIEAAVPNVKIEIDIDQRTIDLTREPIDVAVRYGRGGWKGGRELALFADKLIPVAAPELANLLRRKSTPDAVLALPHLHTGDAVNWRRWSDAMKQTHRIKPTDRFFGDYGVTLAAAEAGLGVALLNTALGAPRLLNDRLVPLWRDAVVGPYGYHALTTSNATAIAMAVVRVLEARSRGQLAG